MVIGPWYCSTSGLAHDVSQDKPISRDRQQTSSTKMHKNYGKSLQKVFELSMAVSEQIISMGKWISIFIRKLTITLFDLHT